MSRQPYRVTVCMPDHPQPADITTLQPDLRAAFEWAHALMPDASSITVEAPREYRP